MTLDDMQRIASDDLAPALMAIGVHPDVATRAAAFVANHANLLQAVSLGHGYMVVSLPVVFPNGQRTNGGFVRGLFDVDGARLAIISGVAGLASNGIHPDDAKLRLVAVDLGKVFTELRRRDTVAYSAANPSAN